MGMIILTVILVIVFLIISVVCFVEAEENDSMALGLIGAGILIMAFVLPFAIGGLHGYINYIESNDKDKARITAITQEQDLLRAYYKIDVEYLTNTPTQSGVVTNYKIEKDTFYCYLSDKELANKIKENLYNEVWIISGYKGGYENYKDFGSHLIKNIEMLEEE